MFLFGMIDRPIRKRNYGVISMKYQLDGVVFADLHDSNNVEFFSQGDYIENMFDRVFSTLTDINGIPLKGRANFKDSYKNTFEKCNIENSMVMIYKLINKHVQGQNTLYFKDDCDSELSSDVSKILELLNHLHVNRIPKRFVAGFLLLMVKFIYFPLSGA
jgi:hypothetical protein